MPALIAVGFEGKHRASEVLSLVKPVNAAWATDLHDAVAVYRTSDGKLRLDQTVKPTTVEGATWGGLLGGLLGMFVAAPFALAAHVASRRSAAGVGALGFGIPGAVIGAENARTLMDTYGVPKDFLRLVSRMVQNVGRSVVLVRVQAADASTATEQFRGYGGQVLRATLAPKHCEAVPWVMSSRTEVSAQGEAATSWISGPRPTTASPASPGAGFEPSVGRARPQAEQRAGN